MKLEFKPLRTAENMNPQVPSVVFIDYESLYISFVNAYSTPPPLNAILSEVKTMGKVITIKAFGDFTKPELANEQNRIRTITSDIIDCGHGATPKKDFTDFIMLDHIYQEAIKNPIVEQFILFTGDGHFSSAATFMRTFMEKTIGVYSVYRSLSRQLMECSSWTKEIRALDEDEETYRKHLLLNLKSCTLRGLVPTFVRTIEHTRREFGGDDYRYTMALRALINDGVVSNELVTMPDRQFKMLSVDWEKAASLIS